MRLSAHPACADRSTPRHRVRDHTYRRQHPQRDDEREMIVVDLAVAHADRGPPGKCGSHHPTGEPWQDIGCRQQTKDHQDQIERCGQGHARRRQVKQTLDQQRLIQLGFLLSGIGSRTKRWMSMITKR